MTLNSTKQVKILSGQAICSQLLLIFSFLISPKWGRIILPLKKINEVIVIIDKN
jgi:hypothetical protein